MPLVFKEWYYVPLILLSADVKRCKWIQNMVLYGRLCSLTNFLFLMWFCATLPHGAGRLYGIIQQSSQRQFSLGNSTRDMYWECYMAKLLGHFIPRDFHWGLFLLREFLLRASNGRSPWEIVHGEIYLTGRTSTTLASYTRIRGLLICFIQVRLVTFRTAILEDRKTWRKKLQFTHHIRAHYIRAKSI